MTSNRQSEREADKQGPVRRDPPTRKRLRSGVDRLRAEFLRRCRERLDPADLGVPRLRRQRTPGLRREDVAALSDISVSWYTWLEQGRDMRVSDDVLERLCRTLRLSEDERVYLFSLVQHRAPPLHGEPQQQAAPDVARMLDGVGMPAVATNVLWDVLAWNRLSARLYGDYGSFPAGSRNVLEILFSHPLRKLSPGEFEAEARCLIGRLRFDYSRKNADDPRFDALVLRLEALSPVFRRLWRSSEFTLRQPAVYRFTQGRFRDLAFEHVSCVPDGYPDIRVIISTPYNLAARRAVLEVLGEESVGGANITTLESHPT